MMDHVTFQFAVVVPCVYGEKYLSYAILEALCANIILYLQNTKYITVARFCNTLTIILIHMCLCHIIALLLFLFF